MDCIVCIDCDGLATLETPLKMQRELLYSVEAYLKVLPFLTKASLLSGSKLIDCS